MAYRGPHPYDDVRRAEEPLPQVGQPLFLFRIRHTVTVGQRQGGHVGAAHRRWWRGLRQRPVGRRLLRR